jgi:hypothetical protein
MAGASRPWYAERLGVALVASYAGLALLGGLVTAELAFPSLVSGRAVTVGSETPLAVPPQLFLYAALGGFAYVFVTLSANPEVDATTVGHLGLRVPAALLVVVGVFLFASALGVATTDAGPDAARALAGSAFLTGFFVEHGLKALRSVSARLYPGDPGELYGAGHGSGDRDR